MSLKNFYPLGVVIALFGALNVPAQNADESTALEQTQELLRNPQRRTAAIESSADATKLNAGLEKLFPTTASKDAVFGISADVMGELVKKYGDDPAKLSEIIEEAKKNPEKFFKSLSPEAQSSISELSKQIAPPEKQRP